MQHNAIREAERVWQLLASVSAWSRLRRFVPLAALRDNGAVVIPLPVGGLCQSCKAGEAGWRLASKQSV